MFGEQEVLISSMLLCSLCDSLNSYSSTFVIVRTSNMAASIHCAGFECQKIVLGTPWFEDFGFLIYVAHFVREMLKL